MKKENVKVAVTDKQQAEVYRKVLAGLGETINRDYYPFAGCLTYCGGWYLSTLENEGKQLITFGQLVDLLTRKPLLISEDGVELFEGDMAVSVVVSDLRIGNPNWCVNDEFGTEEEPSNYKYFSTKQAAIDWIEKMNKPKEIRIDFRRCMTSGVYMTADVSKNEVKLDWIGGCISLGNDEIKQIMDAFDKLR